jgi:hypothetical protein
MTDQMVSLRVPRVHIEQILDLCELDPKTSVGDQIRRAIKEYLARKRSEVTRGRLKRRARCPENIKGLILLSSRQLK